MRRYRAIAQVEWLVDTGRSLGAAIAEVATCPPPDGDRRLSRSSLYRWYERYASGGGLEALLDQPRPPRPSGLDPQLIEFLVEEKHTDREASIPEVIARAREKGVLCKSEKIHRSTLYRAAVALNLPLMRRRRTEATTMRPFAFEHRMMMVLCDGKHFRVGLGGLKRVGLFFIDDATRFILDVFVGTSESAAFFLRSMYKVIGTFGTPSRFYLDRGPGFIADDTEEVLANVGVPLIHGAPRYPEGHAKIERFNGTVTQDVMRGLRKPEIDPSCEALELRLRHYVHQRYNLRPHDGINNKTPKDMFFSDSRALEFPYSETELRSKFRTTKHPKVRRDNVVSVDGTIYEVPLGYTGKRVTVYRDVISGEPQMLHNGVFITLFPPDLGANARELRRKQQKDHEQNDLVTTAAQMHFDRDFRPIVDKDGGFSTSQNGEKS